jgi:hypothetical protein
MDTSFTQHDSLAEALLAALESIDHPKTIENAERIIGRGNKFEIRMTFDRQENGMLRMVTQCREQLKPWTIHIAKNIPPVDAHCA